MQNLVTEAVSLMSQRADLNIRAVMTCDFFKQRLVPTFQTAGPTLPSLLPQREGPSHTDGPFKKN